MSNHEKSHVNELITLLHRLKDEPNARDNDSYEQVITLASSVYGELLSENKALKEDVECLSHIIRDVRERDARKKCLCRGVQ